MKSCLVVDDSHVVRKVARRILEDLGLQCGEAANGQEAYDACAKEMPDSILLDWNMPVMDGIQFLQKLRAMKSGKSPKVVFCTTENDIDHIRRAMDAGADEYVMKPFDSHIIQAKFEQIGLLGT